MTTAPPTFIQSSTFDAITREVARSREKFPGTRFMFAALAEELGELAEVIASPSRRAIRREVIQVCAVALRIYEEGDATPWPGEDALTLRDLVEQVGLVARGYLQRDSVGAEVALVVLARFGLSMHDAGDETFASITDVEAQT